MNRDTFPPRIGLKLYHLRRLSALRLKDLAAQVGCTASMLSKVENGKIAPSFVLLNAVIKALGGNLAYLLAEEGPSGNPIVSAKSRSAITFDAFGQGKGMKLERLIPYSEDHMLQANIHVVAPQGRRTMSISHLGEEVGYVLEGEIELMIGKKRYKVEAGDSFHFRSEQPHKYRNVGTTVARIIWVNTPPAYYIQPVTLISNRSSASRRTTRVKSPPKTGGE